MSAARRFALALTVVASLSLIHAASAHAQACPGNPSGGTWMRPALEEGSGPALPGGFLSGPLSNGGSWRTWLGTFAASRHASLTAVRPAGGRGLLAVTRRASGGR